METYEEKYKDLVKRLNKAREEKGVYTFNSVLDAVAPELKIDESEDERICGKLIAFIKQCKAVYGDGFKQFGLDVDDAIAWLEKKCEQKPLTTKEKLRSLSDGKRHLGWIDDAEKIVAEEQKPEWNEEDERIIDRLCEILYDSHSYGKCRLKLNEYSNLYDWLKSLKDRVQPQSQWKPSDEQISLLQAIVNEPHNAASESCQITLKEVIKQLKKLREE